MFIHIVRQGDTLFKLSRMYQIPVERLRLANGFGDSNLVVGQAVLVPKYTYIVQPGDSFFEIAKKAMVTEEQLRHANPSIQPAAIQPGMEIKIPNISNYLAGTLQYYQVRSPEQDAELISQFAPYSSSIAIFEYHFARNGDIVNTLNDAVAVRTTWQHRVTPLITITNLTSQGFSSDLASAVLNNPTARTNLVNNIAYLTKRHGYGGVNIDFELVKAADRDLFTGFLRELKDRLRQDRLAVTVAVPAKTSEDISWLRGYDYGGIGAVVDYMFIMAYDWHHSGSEPGPVAPITEVRKSIEFAIKTVPSRKIILGVPLYGYDWIIPYSPGRIAPGVSNQNAIETAMRYQSPIQYSEEYQSPYYRYRDQNGLTHEVWFEDVRSMSAKMQLVRNYGLQAIGAWQLSLGFTPGVWLLRKFFTIRKL
ncbi:glycoside hydrolase family 18 protein [Bacillus sp. APMAM]|nr:glycoside hydrolase family 18 protein [Bacillus sp. APMAM]RTZ54424.1 LysM peptidoglycan-binding domain-containing protein [Bacillus sp. SAJ1]